MSYYTIDNLTEKFAINSGLENITHNTCLENLCMSNLTENITIETVRKIARQEIRKILDEKNPDFVFEEIKKEEVKELEENKKDNNNN